MYRSESADASTKDSERKINMCNIFEEKGCRGAEEWDFQRIMYK
jgi:hypothetical protein